MPGAERRLDAAALAVLYRDAHTATRFEPGSVADDDLELLYALTCLTPTAVNSTPLRIAYVRSRTAKERLLPLLAAGNRPKAESAAVTAILAADVGFVERMDRLAPHIPDIARVLPDAASVEEAARFNAALQAGAFILAVRALGYDAGPMNGIDGPAIDAAFLGDVPWRTFMVVNIGVAAVDGVRPRAARLDFDEAARIL